MKTGSTRSSGLISRRRKNNISRKTGQAIADFQLIQDGDNILVALSGGKDSLALLEILLYLQAKAPVKFSLTAGTVDEGFEGFETARIADHCSRKNIPFILKREKILDIIREKNLSGPHFCSFCARLRRGTLYTLAQQQGFNKIALAHHADDFIETLLLDLFYAGSFWKMPVCLVSRRQEITVIRPLVYVYEEEIERFCQDQGFAPVPHPCPFSEAGFSQRARMKQWLTEMARTNPAIKGNLLRAVLKEQKIALKYTSR
ncbi:MAG: ATP-binding protein [bacterium]